MPRKKKVLGPFPGLTGVALPSTSDIFLDGLIRKNSEKRGSRKERDKGKDDDYLKK